MRICIQSLKLHFIILEINQTILSDEPSTNGNLTISTSNYNQLAMPNDSELSHL